jgi:flagellar biosynthesis protein FlhG
MSDMNGLNPQGLHEGCEGEAVPTHQPETIRPEMLRPELLRLVPSKVAHSNRALPIGLEDDILVCAVPKSADPDLGARLTIELGRKVKTVPVLMKKLKPLLLKAYPDDPVPEAEFVVDAVSEPVGRPVKPMAEEDRPNDQPLQGGTRAKVIAITSGKGGVGKSSVTVNLGLSLTKLGYRVLVIDCDFGLSNVHVIMGLKPSYRLPHVLGGQVTAEEAFCEGPDGIRVLAGVAGSSEIAELTYWHLVSNGVNFDALRGQFDFILVDTAAGIQRGIISLLEAADETILVMTPEPTSVQDAYATARLLYEAKPDAKLDVVVNMVRDAKAARNVAAKFQTFLGLYLSSRATFLGHVTHDRAVEAATKTRTPFVLANPRSRPSVDVTAIAKTLTGTAAGPKLSAGFLERLVDKIRAA